MSWVQKLYDTYEECAGKGGAFKESLMPVSHTSQQAHIEINIDVEGDFISAKIVKKEETIIPATEDSAGRTGKSCRPHPLCDKIQYCAADYAKYGGEKVSFYDHYESLLKKWCLSDFSHPKAKAVLNYVQKHSLVQDLVKEEILCVDQFGKLLTNWSKDGEVPEIFRLLTSNSGKKDQGDAFIRWNVFEPGNLCTAVWKDIVLWESWLKFDQNMDGKQGLCMVTGKVTRLAVNHPKRIRFPGDGAKLISANDKSGYTFLGRFTDKTGEQACGISREVTQKAHNALRWLIKRQGYKNGEQVIVSWSVKGSNIPDPFENTYSLFINETEDNGSSVALVHDVGQSFALRLNKAISGYRAQIDDVDDIVVMGMDSATPGRMAVTFYRELKGVDFLERIRCWHESFAWPQKFSTNLKFIGAPAPREIAEAAYGPKADEKLRKSTVERLLPSIIDGQRIPRDIVQSAIRRACQRQALENSEWDKVLGIACALYKGFFKEKKYQMSLETNRKSRDYLFGRLLAVADSIESYALEQSKETRQTTAARLMQRFADRPFSTWRNIELALAPYMVRLGSSEKTIPFLKKRKNLLDEVMFSFEEGDFCEEKDRPLSGEFLLGYHCQRQALFFSRKNDGDNQSQKQEQSNNQNV